MAKQSNKILLFMVACAILAFGFGVVVLKSRSNPVPQSQTQNSEQKTDNSQQERDVQTDTQNVSITSWKTYNNDKHTFSIQYPPNLRAGSVSGNSVLGTFQEPVRGYHVGPLVLVILKDAELRTEAEKYFEGVYKAATNPPASEGGEIPPIECKVDKVTNQNVVSIKAVSCTGEGGAAKYAYIDGQSYDVFVDGYSKGYDNADNGEFTSIADYITVLSTFKFKTETASTTDTSASTTSTASTSTPSQPKIESFTIVADDSSASPTQITVTKDAIVQITFNVGTNVYYGGLEFRSSVVNSGTIAAGGTKTVSFKATESFTLKPYWPASNVPKNYSIYVYVQ